MKKKYIQNSNICYCDEKFKLIFVSSSFEKFYFCLDIFGRKQGIQIQKYTIYIYRLEAEDRIYLTAP